MGINSHLTESYGQVETIMTASCTLNAVTLLLGI